MYLLSETAFGREQGENGLALDIDPDAGPFRLITPITQGGPLMLRNVDVSDDAPARERNQCCQVVNFKQYGSKEALDKAFGDRWTYIGRGNRHAGMVQSPLANPFKVSDFGGRRGVTLPYYRRWLWDRIKADDTAVIEALRAIDKTSILVCWCAPSPCHGKVVKVAAAWLHSQIEP